MNFNVTINVTAYKNVSYCYFNITRGASIEVGNIVFNLSKLELSQNVSISNIGNYNLNVWCNNSFNFSTLKILPFTITSGAGSSGGSGGGSSIGDLFNKLTNQTQSGEICNPFFPKTQTAWDVFRKEKTWNAFRSFLHSYFDFVLCKGSAEIVPI